MIDGARVLETEQTRGMSYVPSISQLLPSIVLGYQKLRLESQLKAKELEWRAVAVDGGAPPRIP